MGKFVGEVYLYDCRFCGESSRTAVPEMPCYPCRIKEAEKREEAERVNWPDLLRWAVVVAAVFGAVLLAAMAYRPAWFN